MFVTKSAVLIKAEQVKRSREICVQVCTVNIFRQTVAPSIEMGVKQRGYGETHPDGDHFE
jgi:hypothetical protein